MEQIPRRVYEKPHLEQQEQYALITGVSLPIGTTGIDNLLEINDLMEGEQ